MRAKKRNSAGYTLLTVVILLAIVSAAVALSLDEAMSSVQDGGRARAAEIIKSGLDHGLTAAMTQLQSEDVATLVDPSVDWDIFDAARPVTDDADYLPALAYPPEGPYQNQYRIRVGLRPGQRTRAPSGEDVRTGYGQVVEVQIGVEAVGAGIPPAEERVAVGVLIPRTVSHGN